MIRNHFSGKKYRASWPDRKNQPLTWYSPLHTVCRQWSLFVCDSLLQSYSSPYPGFWSSLIAWCLHQHFECFPSTPQCWMSLSYQPRDLITSVGQCTLWISSLWNCPHSFIFYLRDLHLILCLNNSPCFLHSENEWSKRRKEQESVKLYMF
jgi:hypothetical protein